MKPNMRRYTTFSNLIPFSIIIIVIASTAAVFFISVHQNKAQETVDLWSQKSLHIKNEPKKITAVLPANKNKIVEEPKIELPVLVVEEIAEKINQTEIVDNVLLDVPFVSQAPFGEWEDPRQDYGCEETSFLMVMHYRTGKPLTNELAKKEIIELSDWELEHHGEFRDSSAADSVEWFSEYFELDDITLKYNVTIDDIKNELRKGNPVIVPMDGQILENPYYTPPGPLHHMMVVIGFDEEASQFITNDPGTRRGKHLRYSYNNFYDALRDYETGHGLPVDEIRKPMIIIH